MATARSSPTSAATFFHLKVPIAEVPESQMLLLKSDTRRTRLWGSHTPWLLLKHKEAYSHLWLTAIAEESKKAAGAPSSQGSCDIKAKLSHSSKFVSETLRTALNFTMS